MSSSGSAVRSISLQSNGRIVAAGGTLLHRYLADGSLDSSFGPGGTVTAGLAINDLAVQADGNILAGGEASRHLSVARYTTAGAPDTSFAVNGQLTTPIGEEDQAAAVALQSDGKAIAGGYTVGDSYGPLPSWLLVRYLNQGLLLNASLGGTGTGTITSRPPYASGPNLISCPVFCSAAFPVGSKVVLTATPARGSVFAGWTGSCSGHIPVCALVMNSTLSASAIFARCLVPNVIGRPLRKARHALASAHCSLGAVWRRASRRVRKGHVIAQQPRPGTRRPAGSDVSLVLSRGRR